LWPEIFVCVPCHCIFTCRGTEQGKLRSLPFNCVSVMMKNTLIISKSPFSHVLFPYP
jgi:hypothetical protein